MSKKITLIASGPIRHDGKCYAEGDSLSVTEPQAAQLLAAGSAAAPLAERKPAGRKATSTDPTKPQGEGAAASGIGSDDGADGNGNGGE